MRPGKRRNPDIRRVPASKRHAGADSLGTVRKSLLPTLLLTLFVAAPAHAAGFETPGVKAKAPTEQTLDTTTEQLTGGLSNDEVVAQNACSTPKPGQATCFAKTLVERAGHKRIHPHVRSQRTFTQVFPSRRQGIAPATAAGAPAAAAPGAGTPAWLQQAYDLTYLSQTQGGTATVGIVDAYDNPTAESDLAIYRARYGLPACTTANGCLKKLNQNGATSPMPSANSGWAQEIALDLDAVSALCPNCKIVLVEANTSYSNDLAAAIAAAVNAGAEYISNSYGAGEYSVDPYFNKTFPGVSLIASTGDNGTYNSSVNSYPAAIPGIIAAGGTSLALSGGSPTARGFGESAWSGAGSGCNTHSGITKPSYQTDPLCPGRAYADVSAVADPNTGLMAYDTGTGGWFVVGGTSLSSPLIAAYLAVTGVDGTTPKWAYDNSALLNDPVSGSNGGCTISYICHAATGYDGPTGMGSISGALVTGAPGVAAPSKSSGYMQTAGGTTATLAGGVYPNSLDTTYFWQYGTTTSYDSQSTAAGAGSGTAPVLTSTTLTGLAPSTTYHYRLVAQNSAGMSYGYDYTFTTANAGANPPSNTVAPVITGTPQQGQTLIVAPGTWSPAAISYTYQWQRSTDGGATWTPISGATGTAYTASTADLGAKLRVLVTASNQYGANSATTAPVGPIGSGAPANTSPPVINGITRRGQVLTVSSTWNPASSNAYQWQRSLDGGVSWVSIGANTSSYTLVSADLGALIRVTVTASNVFGSATATSAGVGLVVADPPLNTVAPTVGGTTQRTYVLTASRGTWAGTGNTYSYQWQRSEDGTTFTNISGATNATYTLGVADEGDWVRALVSAGNADGASAQATAATADFIAPYPPANTIPPSITGMPQRTAVLTASRGTWTGPDNSYSYQWQRDAGEGFTDIPGAVGANYTLTLADEFTNVRVVVKAANPDGVIMEASQATTLVQDAGPLNQTPPVVSGTVQRGVTLTANAGTWSGLGNSYAFQWQSSTDGVTWTNVGATTSSYVLGVGDEGKQVRVKVTATNADGSQSATSNATINVPASPPVATVRPTVTGAAQRGTTLTSTRGTWDGVGNFYAYRWQRDNVDIEGATGIAYTLTVADEGAKIRLVVTVTNPDGTATAISDPTATVAAAPPVNRFLPTVTGTAARASVLTASQGAWTGIGNTYVLQWQVSSDGSTWADVAGANGPTYTIAYGDVSKRVRMLVTGTNADGTVSAASAPTTVVPAAPPVSTSRPTVSGTTQRGSVMSATLGAWNGIGNTYAYQWQRDAGSGYADIAGATAAIYTLAVADEYASLRVIVTATNSDGGASAISTGTAPIAAAPPVNSSRPTIAGSAQRASILTSSIGAWGGVANDYAYQWQRDAGAGFVDIANATGASYTLGVADEGAKVRLLVIVTNADGSLTAASDPTATVTAAPPLNTSRPVISGVAARGTTISTTAGAWNGVGNEYAYQWQRSADSGTTWRNINGATDLTYTPAVADVGAILRVVVTVTNPDGTASQASLATVPVAARGPINTITPAISGLPQRASVLSATTGTWTGSGNQFSYQWQRDGGSGFAAIPGATGSTYQLTLADEGAVVRIVVTATNPEGTVSSASSATATVQAAPPISTAPPVITGMTQRASTLTATQGSWLGANNLITYQWQRNGVDVSGAGGPTYTLGVADEGAKLRVVVTATNPDGTVSATSAATATVIGAPPAYTQAPTISGSAKRLGLLSANTGVWSGIGNVYSYQWQRDSGAGYADIAGATGQTYTLGSADVGARLRLRVTGTNPDGAVTATTGPTAVVQAAAPVAGTLPTVAGTAALGSRLTADPGAWTPADVTYAYQWQRAGVDIPGATSTSYILVRADVGFSVRMKVTATNVDGTAGVFSAATAVVTAPPVNTGTPTAPSGTVMEGSRLSADSGTWDTPGAVYSYVWYRCAADATALSSACVRVGLGDSYTPTSDDIANTLGVRVTASTSGGSTTADGALSGAVAPMPMAATELPYITGTPQVPHTLTANAGKWNLPLTSVSYTWKRCDADGTSNCQTVEQSSDEYALSAADDGHTIVLFVDANGANRTGSAHSLPLLIAVAPVPQPTLLPTISGTPVRGGTLTAGTGTWTNVPTHFDYQWQRCDAGGLLRGHRGCDRRFLRPRLRGRGRAPDRRRDGGQRDRARLSDGGRDRRGRQRAAGQHAPPADPGLGPDRPGRTADDLRLRLAGDARHDLQRLLGALRRGRLRPDRGRDRLVVHADGGGRQQDAGRRQHGGQRRRHGVRALGRDGAGDDGRTALEDAPDREWRQPRRRLADDRRRCLDRPGGRHRHDPADALHERLQRARLGERHELQHRLGRRRRDPSRPRDRLQRGRRHRRLVDALHRPGAQRPVGRGDLAQGHDDGAQRLGRDARRGQAPRCLGLRGPRHQARRDDQARRARLRQARRLGLRGGAQRDEGAEVQREGQAAQDGQAQAARRRHRSAARRRRQAAWLTSPEPLSSSVTCGCPW